MSKLWGQDSGQHNHICHSFLWYLLACEGEHRISLFVTLSNGLTRRSRTPYGRVTEQDLLGTDLSQQGALLPGPSSGGPLGGDSLRDSDEVDVMALIVVILAWSVVEDEQPSECELNLGRDHLTLRAYISF
jgi:hypothetical protein